MLHIINQLPLSANFFDKTQSGDTVIFTDDAILAVKQNNVDIEYFTKRAFNHINLCVRKADLIIKNISKRDLLRDVTIIDEVQFENAMHDNFAIKSYN